MKSFSIPFSLAALQKAIKLHSPTVDVGIRLGDTRKELHIKASAKGVAVKMRKGKKRK